MRLFLNAVFDFKAKDKAFTTVPPVLREVLLEGGWNPQRFLFDLYDINEAASEGHTPHAKLIKKFPQLTPYWHNTSQRFAAMNHRPPWSNEPIPPTSAHGYGFFSNFPGRKSGVPLFFPWDPAIDMETLEGICASIPRPCPFYSAIAVWDGIAWYPDSSLIPALRNVQLGHGYEDFAPGDWPSNHDFYECCVGYQSNCLLLSFAYGTGPELEVRVELTDNHPMEDALAVVERFAQRLGKPVKQLVRAVYPWEQREKIAGDLAAVGLWFQVWRQSTVKALKTAYCQAQENPPEKPVSAKTLVKRFVAHNSFSRHNLCRWDDYGWCKRLPHGYWLYLSFAGIPTARYSNQVSIGLTCYGANFQLQYSCSLFGDLGAPRNSPADEAAFHAFQILLERFEAEVVPSLAQTFGDTPPEFYQHSHSWDYTKEFDVTER